MRWVELVPSEFEKLAREESLCVVPMGSLERHGEHIPFGCDMIIGETLCEIAAQKTPCVVFPGYFLGQVHEAACFTGTVNLPQALAVEVLSRVLQGIAENGFTKIAIVNAHGGNRSFLEYFSMSQLDEQRSYVLYIINAYNALNEQEEKDLARLWETPIFGHADELETSLFMACRPGLSRMDLAGNGETLPTNRFAHLRPRGIQNAHWWYADFPQNVTGAPRAATEEKGRRALEIMATAVARGLQIIKDDTTAPTLQKEFLDRVRNKGKV